MSGFKIPPDRGRDHERERPERALHSVLAQSLGTTPRSISPLSRSSTPVLSHSSSHTSVKETSYVNLDYDPVSGRTTLNTYEVIKELGRGQHGKVKLGRDLVTGDYVAIKVVDRLGKPKLGKYAQLRRDSSSDCRNVHEEAVKREIAILKKCEHPHIVKLLEVMDDIKSRKIFMVLEYCDGGEIKWQNEDGSPSMTMDEARHVFRHVLLGLEYLHFQGIIHRDIKPANLLMSNRQVKISDFGVSFTAAGDTTLDEIELAKTAGTPAFFAPELCQNNAEKKNCVTNKIDVWALGVTLYCLLYGKVPFSADSEYELFEVICRDEVAFPCPKSSSSSPPPPPPAHQLSPESSISPPICTSPISPPQASSLLSSSSSRVTSRDATTAHSHATATREPRDLSQARMSSRSSLSRYFNHDKIATPSSLSPSLTPLSDEELAHDLILKLLEKDPEKRISIPEIKAHPWTQMNMCNEEAKEFDEVFNDEQRIEITNEDLQTAVSGIGSKIRKGLSKLGTSALAFAGIKRRGSGASTATRGSSATSRGATPIGSPGSLERAASTATGASTPGLGAAAGSAQSAPQSSFQSSSTSQLSTAASQLSSASSASQMRYGDTVITEGLLKSSLASEIFDLQNGPWANQSDIAAPRFPPILSSRQLRHEPQTYTSLDPHASEHSNSRSFLPLTGPERPPHLVERPSVSRGLSIDSTDSSVSSSSSTGELELVVGRKNGGGGELSSSITSGGASTIVPGTSVDTTTTARRPRLVSDSQLDFAFDRPNDAIIPHLDDFDEPDNMSTIHSAFPTMLTSNSDADDSIISNGVGRKRSNTITNAILQRQRPTFDL